MRENLTKELQRDKVLESYWEEFPFRLILKDWEGVCLTLYVFHLVDPDLGVEMFFKTGGNRMRG